MSPIKPKSVSNTSPHPAFPYQDEQSLTPMMQQYTQIKREYSKAILFFRLGDFYEMFGEDAMVASRILQITLTSRNKNNEKAIPLCGIPYHAAQGYIARLIKAGHTVAICEQMEDPKKAKGVVKREVIKVVTPGTIIDSNLLEGKENNFLGALALESGGLGLALVDISTGEFWATEYRGQDWYGKLETEISRKSPRELIVSESTAKDGRIQKLWSALPHLRLETLEDGLLRQDAARQCLKDHFQVLSLTSLGCDERDLAVLAASMAVSYLQKTQKCDLSHLRRWRWYNLNDFMVIDATTQQHLELVSSWQDAKKTGSLLSVLDLTQTPMGGRMLKHWLLHPLLRAEEINQRLEAVDYFVNYQIVKQNLREYLKKIYDLERIGGKIALLSASPVDLISLKNSLSILPHVKALLQQEPAAPLVSVLRESCHDLQDLYQWIHECLADHPPATLQDVGIIREGYSQELDELRQIAFAGKSWIARLESKERQKTGISSLKIRYNKVFGYYIEVTKTHLHAVPDSYIRKQTIANGERYITAELKDYETKVLTAQEKIGEMEKAIFQDLLSRLSGQLPRLQETSHSLASLDVLTSLAEAASLYHYVKPSINTDSGVHIIEGRHPVVERLSENSRFVPNDTHLDCEENQLLIITGPNMAGKSTYIRQVALIALMAQMGSFVPAERAVIGLVDRIFTRVGAFDNLVKGQSTFMVEMSETANILNNATSRSLIILDEIGRGTSTYDGMSIAWAVAEYLHSQEIGAKTLFATHYHELTRLADSLEKVQNYNVAVREWNDEVIFLHKIVPGGTDRSYGIEVARLAGLPPKVIARAKEILKTLEKQDSTVGSSFIEDKRIKGPRQLSLFTSPDEYVVSELRSANLDQIPVRELLKIVKKWQKLLSE